jgi:hypothetical protein
MEMMFCQVHEFLQPRQIWRRRMLARRTGLLIPILTLLTRQFQLLVMCLCWRTSSYIRNESPVLATCEIPSNSGLRCSTRHDSNLENVSILNPSVDWSSKYQKLYLLILVSYDSLLSCGFYGLTSRISFLAFFKLCMALYYVTHIILADLTKGRQSTVNSWNL